MNHMLLWAEDFDHTYWCYVTDYIQAAWFLTISLVIFVLPCKPDDLHRKAIRFHSCLALGSMGLFSLLAAIVHQCFLNDNDVMLYNFIWEIGTAFGLTGAIFTFYIGFLMLNRDFKWFRFTYAVFLLDFLAFFIFVFQVVVMGTMLTVVIFLIVMASLQYRLTKNIQMIAFIVFCAIATVLCISGAVCYFFEYKPSPDFNHHSIQHVLTMLGVPLVYVMPMFGFKGMESIGVSKDEQLVSVENQNLV